MLRRAILAGLVCGLSLAAPLHAGTGAPAQDPPQDLTDLSLAELAHVEVTTFSRRPQRTEEVPAALHVITGADIRRQGATTLPQALRSSPGVQVARIDASKVAVGIRGFPGRLSRAMLVLVDGRSVYDTLYAGTLWETPDVVLDDVERIEVIRGPGGALWGANAVNGIVNVITRSAADTQGGLLRLRVGSDDRQVTARWGGAASDAFHYRVWTKLFDRDGARNDTFPGFDDWRMGRVGGRADWTRRPGETVTLDSALYRGDVGQVVRVVTLEPPSQVPTPHDARLDGGHLLARWRRAPDGGGETEVQAFFDAADRDEAHFDEWRRTLDVEATHARRLGRHHLGAGAGYRRAHVDTVGTEGAFFEPADKVDTIVSAFVQDETAFAADRVRLTGGLKLERNPYSDWEVQPNLRVFARASRHHSFWGSVSRAVRTPSRTERELVLTSVADAGARTFTRILGTDDFVSEVVRAYEAGWRAELAGARLAVQVAAFSNHYDRLLGLEVGSPFTEGVPARVVVPVLIRNALDGTTRGVELSARAQSGTRTGIEASWSVLDVDLEPVDPAGDRSQEAVEGYSPRHRLHVLGWIGLPHGFDGSAALRHHAELPGLKVPAYTELDARLAWTRASLELAVVGRNLLHPDHVEWPGGAEGVTRIPRAAFVQASWRF